MNRSTRSFGAALSFLIAQLALAQEHAPPAPPQEAVNACAGRETGASCTFQHDGRSVSGSCLAMPGGTDLACAPLHLHLRRGPPPEALAACRGQQDGATCQFTAPRGETIAGVCRSGPARRAAGLRAEGCASASGRGRKRRMRGGHGHLASLPRDLETLLHHARRRDVLRLLGAASLLPLLGCGAGAEPLGSTGTDGATLETPTVTGSVNAGYEAGLIVGVTV